MMENKSQDFSMNDVMRIAKSPAGQQLIAMLQQKDSAALAEAASQAKAGNYSQAGQTLSALLSSPEAQRLMKELGGK